ncbi:MAG TPA: hypothetical protein VD997_16425 [Phycisphaerales bacterium]|nr:hypothetical protein [Phycisphaerales bacterium]
MTLLAYTPFIDPVNINQYWYLLLLPVSLLVSLSYKACRVESLSDLPREVGVMTVQIVVVMILLGVASFLFVEKVLPMIAA